MIQELKDQVTNLELSKRLRELGFPQESLFYWDVCIDNRDGALREKERDLELIGCDWISTYTTSELGTIIGKYITHEDIEAMRMTNTIDREMFYEFLYDFASANVYAKMLIYLAEHNLIEIPKR